MHIRPIIITNGIINYRGYQKPDGMWSYFLSRLTAQEQPRIGFSGCIWEPPGDLGSAWRIIPLTRID